MIRIFLPLVTFLRLLVSKDYSARFCVNYSELMPAIVIKDMVLISEVMTLDLFHLRQKVINSNFMKKPATVVVSENVKTNNINYKVGKPVVAFMSYQMEILNRYDFGNETEISKID